MRHAPKRRMPAQLTLQPWLWISAGACCGRGAPRDLTCFGGTRGSRLQRALLLLCFHSPLSRSRIRVAGRGERTDTQRRERRRLRRKWAPLRVIFLPCGTLIFANEDILSLGLASSVPFSLPQLLPFRSSSGCVLLPTVLASLLLFVFRRGGGGNGCESMLLLFCLPLFARVSLSFCLSFLRAFFLWISFAVYTATRVNGWQSSRFPLFGPRPSCA